MQSNSSCKSRAGRGTCSTLGGKEPSACKVTPALLPALKLYTCRELLSPQHPAMKHRSAQKPSPSPYPEGSFPSQASGTQGCPHPVKPVPRWGTLSIPPQPHVLYFSSPTQRAVTTLHETNTKHSSGCLGHRDLALQGRGSHPQRAPFLAAGKQKPQCSAAVWGCSSIPTPAGPPYRSLVQHFFASGRWKSHLIRPFPRLPDWDRQCLGECSHRPFPHVFKQGHILFLRML